MITEKILEKIDNKEINPEEELGIKMGNKGESEPTLKDRSQQNKDKPGEAMVAAHRIKTLLNCINKSTVSGWLL